MHYIVKTWKKKVETSFLEKYQVELMNVLIFIMGMIFGMGLSLKLIYG